MDWMKCRVAKNTKALCTIFSSNKLLQVEKNEIDLLY
jgi:hypothetical protein